MQETNLMKNKIIKLRAEFIDLLGYLEKQDINYVDYNELVGFIYMDPKNEFRYKISKVTNNNETYTFQYIKSHSENNNIIQIEVDIPNAIFSPNILFDFDIDLENKTIKKLDEYNHIMINIDDNSEKIISKTSNKNIIRKLFGC
jgi:hypothetical protein